MIGTLLFRGLAAGLVAGLLAGAFAFAFGEPAIDRAIALEEAAAQTAPTSEPPPPLGRSGQKLALVVLAGPLFGLAMGGLFALGFGAIRGRTGGDSDWTTSTRLAALLFVALVLVPALKYPANPPAVGNPETIGSRTALYLVLMATSLLALIAAWRLTRQLAERAPWVRQLAGGAVFVVTVGIAFAILPSVQEVPRGFPAQLLWEFRVTSLGAQAVLWSSLGVAFGLACQLSPLPSRRKTGEFAAVEGTVADEH